MAIILIKRSIGTATPGTLAEGEMAYSENSDNLFVGKSGATVVKIGGLTDVNKLAGIEAGAKDDQTGAEIKAAYEAESNTNAFTDAEKTLLGGVEALADVTDAVNVAAAGALMDGDFGSNGTMIRTAAGTYSNLLLNLSATVDPTVSNDNVGGYVIGSRWINTVGGEEFVCVDASTGAAIWIAATGGGDLNGPASATDNGIARFNGTTGKLVQDSLVTIADTTGDLSTIGSVTAGSIITAGNVDGRDVSADGSALDGHLADTTGNPHAVTLEQARTSGATFAGNIAMGTNRITGLADGIAATDAATVQQVDAASAGILVKAQCRVATTDTLAVITGNTYTATGTGVGKTLSTATVGIVTIDGVALLLADRVLVKNEVADIDNGIYEVTVEGTAGVAMTLTRATDFDGSPAKEITEGSFTFIDEGTLLGKTGWVLLDDADFTAGVANVDVAGNSLVFSQFQGLPQYTGGVGININGDDVSLDINELTAATIVGADSLAFYDLSGTGVKKTTVTNFLADLGLTSALADTLTSANVFVGNASNVATGVAMTGDISITNAGVTLVETLDGGSF